MKTSITEQSILKFLKFSPSIITIFFSALIVALIYLVNLYTFKNEIVQLKKEFTKTNKDLIKNEVEKVSSFIIHQKEQTTNLLKKNIKENVNIAHALINETYLYHQNKSKDEIKVIIKKALKDLRFNNGIGYFFIVSQEGEMIFHPFLPELENANVLGIKDPNGTPLFKNMANLAKEKKESFYEWFWFKPNKKEKKEKKIGYLKNIDSLNWFIASGYYLDDFENILKKDIFEYTPKIKFGQNGYVFIVDYEGNILSHPNKKFIGNNILNKKDKSGKYYVQEIIKTAKKEEGEGYLNYYDPSLPNEKTFLKTSFIKSIPDWNFLIGAGFNEDELNNKILEKQKILNKANDEYIVNMLIVTIITTLLLTFIAIYISKIIQRLFLKYKVKIAQEIQKNHDKDMMIAQQSKMNALGDMIGNIAHQWRQPLSTITTASSGLFLKFEFEKLKEEDLISFTQAINDNAQYLSKTIEEFKEFFEPRKTKDIFEIEQTIKKTLNIISSQFISHNIQIITDIKNAKIYGIENELMQILINILNNSKEALNNLNINKKLIFIDIYTRKDSLYIDIKDNAKGIKENILPRVFEPYFTTKFKSQGIGIGLYMCYEMITKHFNGKISVHNTKFKYDNEEHIGAKFTVILPISKKE